MVEVVAGQLVEGNIGTVVFDLDGVVYVDGRGIPGAGEVLNRLTAAGVLVLFATNNSTKTPATAASQIAATTGYACRPEQVVTSSFATARGIAGRFRRAFVIGEQGLGETLRAAGLATVEDWRDADVVVAGLDRELTYRDLTAAALAINVGEAAFIATNTDATYPTAAGPVPGGGAIVAAISTATGVTPEVYGKPHRPYRDILRGLTRGATVMVGDRIETDIALGKAEGWVTVLVLTGVTRDPAAISAADAPDHVIASIADLPELLGL